MLENEPALTIGDVAKRTGVAVPRLRAWEARFGFPAPERLPSGHRRYRPSDVDRIERILRDAERGLSLATAVARARDALATRPSSIFGGLREHHPALPRNVLGKRSMLAVSRAIEDECLAAGRASVLVGCFQHERFYRVSERRWRDLARTAETAFVFAEVSSHRRRSAPPVVVALPSSTALLREWAVVCDAPDASAVLAGWERPGRRRNDERSRRFEAVWSADPVIVRRATLIALSLAVEHGGGRWELVAEQLPPVVDDPAGALRRATSLTNRVLAYL